ncbi:MAG: cyclic nucleotide-binding domain-containing protein [Polyangiaceae bacterium]|nr:cyclic nucleotide-binding domain-containing protein [Polyangiaceae bacterium]
MTEPSLPDLFAYGKRTFDSLVADLRAHGIAVHPDIGIRRGDGVMSYYSIADRKIYLSVPNPQTPVGKLQTMVLASVLTAGDEGELHALFEVFLPRLIAHELAHHLRHAHGKFGSNPWEEEQVANRFARALTLRRMAPAERTRARELVERVLNGLSPRIGVKDAATMSYHDVLFALNAAGKMGDTTVQRAAVAQRMFDAETQRMLAESGDLPTAIGKQLDLRQALIADINSEYADDFLKYVYYHAGWLHLDLTGRDPEYVEALAREHLGVHANLLPLYPENEQVGEENVVAAFAASVRCKGISEPAARHLYKRYRALLWRLLREQGLLRPGDRDVLNRESAFFLESFSEGASDALKYVAHLASERVRALFPSALSARAKHLPAPDVGLLHETDARLYSHVVHFQTDLAAENTLARLTLLETSNVLSRVPAESVMALSHVLTRIVLAPGETLFWEGEESADVFLPIRGEIQLAALGHVLGVVQPGVLLGETAFFSRRPRHLTARALTPCELYVIPSTDLISFAYRHPSVLMQIGGVFARRLEDGENEAAADMEEPRTLQFVKR